MGKAAPKFNRNDLQKLQEDLKHLESLNSKRDSLTKEIEDLERRAKPTQALADQKAREMIVQAEQSARQILRDAEQQVKGLSRREVDLATREEAVKWVDAKIEELKKAEQDLKKRQKEAEKARVEGQSAAAHWTTRLKELDAKDESLRLREAKLAVELKKLQVA